MNLCRTCGADFSSVETFDRHRVGSHERLASEGHPDGRRCLSLEEMSELGWEQDVRARWFDPARTERARTAFGNASVRSGAAA